MIERRKPIARSTVPLKRSAIKGVRKPIPSRSAKRIASMPERAAVVDAAFVRDKGECQARRLVPYLRCGGTRDAHEIIPRSAWPGGELVLENVLVVCRNHHVWIGHNPNLARERGLHGFSHERP